MKSILICLAFVLTISCTQQSKEFRGFADLKIGTDFNSLPGAEKFTKIMEDEYNISTYQLSYKIGSVSNLNITTDHGKISEVKFTSNENTNTAALAESSKNMVALSISDIAKAPSKINLENVQFYTTADSTIFYAIIYKNKHFKNGNAKNDYQYLSKDFQLKKAAKILSQHK